MQRLKAWMGVELDPVSPKEKFVSIVGGLLSIFLVIIISRTAFHAQGSAMIIASMGASAVLLFAVPHGSLSQPWPVLAGHIFSALIGVTCSKFIPNREIAGACAVGLSIGAMHQFKCIHPPGGATALTAVIGGPAVTAMGYSYVLMPVALNSVAIVAIAVAFNYAFQWRRYPVALIARRKPSIDSGISHEEVVAALRSLDSFVDIAEDDLIRLCDMLAKKGNRSSMPMNHVSQTETSNRVK